ncbi:alpha/beta hydrolase [Gordonia alkaliphila]|uniref:Prolyl oligopeptidase family serine peptidase n=1 Tax=Gordonia alkaliphila TaxID=1053547 RepID=A0ABP8Z3J5_9ACTN|nr:alpha/beta hydrolase [Gordonia alkaliphila]MCK0438126.1 alpha/beta hydrolase [Gordonia alkaliphila]
MNPRRSRLQSPRLRKTLAATTAVAALAAGGVVTATQAFAEPDTAQPSQPSRSAPGQTAGAVYANQQLLQDSLPTAAAAGQRYSYWTTGVDDSLHLAIATILEPKGKAPAGGWPVVVNAPAGYGIAETCNASSGPVAGNRDTVAALLRNGFAVITPDYGMVGAGTSPQYIDHAVTARNLLDAVLAGVVVDGSVAPQWAVLGEAQGAAAAIELARKGTQWQGRDSDFQGAVATSIPAGIDVLISGLKPSSPAVSETITADVVYALASLEADDVASVLSKTGQQLVTKAQTMCAPDLRDAVKGVALGDLVSKSVASSPKLAASLRRSLALPRNGFSRPLMMSQTLRNDANQVHEALRYLADAQLASNKVTAKTYFTPDAADGDRQEKAAVLTYLEGLF